MAQRSGSYGRMYVGPNRPAAERKQRTEARLAEQRELIKSGKLSADPVERARSRGFLHVSRADRR